MGEVDLKLHLSDQEYLELLKRGRKFLDKLKRISGYDSTAIGNKFTECDGGLGNDLLTTKDIAMWPEDFPHRRSMKYRQEHHKCPLDMRPVSREFRSGCFYTCMIFSKKVKTPTVEEAKKLYDKRIEEVEQELMVSK